MDRDKRIEAAAAALRKVYSDHELGDYPEARINDMARIAIDAADAEALRYASTR
jgi:hypothetical protein